MTRKIIAVDADDTLFDENTAVRLFMNEIYGMNHTAEDYDIVGPYDNYWESIWQLNSQQTNAKYEEFVVSTYKENLEPIKGAIEALQTLKQTYDLVVVTSRDDRTVELTHQSLAKHYPNLFEDVHFTPLWGNGEKATKAKICNEIGANYLIDDSFDHCKLAADAGVEAILFGDYGWNRSQALPNGISRCKNWEAVEAYFSSKYAH